LIKKYIFIYDEKVIHTTTNADGSVSVWPKTKIYYC
jgi:hypothetical protein